MPATWRLLVDDGPAEGSWNMALDRAIQLSRDAGDAPATLRLYEWARPTVTLGRFQELGTIDTAYCSAHGIDVVRRFTGGRGVLHDDEVTYSIVASLADGIPRGTVASYRLLCEGLARAYAELGVDAQLTARPRGTGSSAACYLHATPADLSQGVRKLSGSAQVWSGQTVLQHGSLTLSRNTTREAGAFGLSASDATRLAEETITLATALGRAPTRRQVREAASQGIAQALGVDLVVGHVSQCERELAESLLDEVEARRPIRQNN